MLTVKELLFQLQAETPESHLDREWYLAQIAVIATEIIEGEFSKEMLRPENSGLLLIFSNLRLAIQTGAADPFPLAETKVAYLLNDPVTLEQMNKLLEFSLSYNLTGSVFGRVLTNLRQVA